MRSNEWFTSGDSNDKRRSSKSETSSTPLGTESAEEALPPEMLRRGERAHELDPSRPSAFLLKEILEDRSERPVRTTPTSPSDEAEIPLRTRMPDMVIDGRQVRLHDGRYQHDRATEIIEKADSAEKGDEDAEGDDNEEDGGEAPTQTKKVVTPPTQPRREAAQVSVAQQIIDRLDADTHEAFAETEERIDALVDANVSEPTEPSETVHAAEPPRSAERPLILPPVPEVSGFGPDFSTPLPPPPGGGPPRPPIPPIEGDAFYPPEPEPTPFSYDDEIYSRHPAFASSEPSADRYAAMPPGNPNYISVEQHQAAVHEAAYRAERYGVRRGVVAGFITGWVVKQHLSNRKLHRIQQEHRQALREQQHHIAELDAAQAHLDERVRTQEQQIDRYRYQPQTRIEQPALLSPATPFEQAAAQAMFPSQGKQPMVPAVETLSPIVSRPNNLPGEATQLQATTQTELPSTQPSVYKETVPLIQEIDRQPPPDNRADQQVVQEPGQHLERSGWYSAVVDEHGREIPGAIRYGEAHQREQRQERSPHGVTGQQQTKPGVPSQRYAGGGSSFVGGSTQHPQQMISSGQTGPSHQLPTGYDYADAQHRLPAKSVHSIASAISSPWLWAGVVILLLTFFITALA